MLGATAELYMGVAFDSAIFCGLDLHLFYRKAAIGTARLVDHVWRMLAAMLFAMFALFVANPDIFPNWFVARGLNYLPPASMVALIVYWVVRLRRAEPVTPGITTSSS